MTERAGLGTSQSGDGEKSFEINVREAPGRQNFLSFLFRRARADTWPPSQRAEALAPRAGLVPGPAGSPRLAVRPGPAPPPRGGAHGREDRGDPALHPRVLRGPPAPSPPAMSGLPIARRCSAARQALRKLHFPTPRSRCTGSLADPPSPRPRSAGALPRPQHCTDPAPLRLRLVSPSLREWQGRPPEPGELWEL